MAVAVGKVTASHAVFLLIAGTTWQSLWEKSLRVSRGVCSSQGQINTQQVKWVSRVTRQSHCKMCLNIETNQPQSLLLRCPLLVRAPTLPATVTTTSHLAARVRALVQRPPAYAFDGFGCQRLLSLRPDERQMFTVS